MLEVWAERGGVTPNGESFGWSMMTKRRDDQPEPPLGKA
jgi:hypothetical protein